MRISNKITIQPSAFSINMTTILCRVCANTNKSCVFEDNNFSLVTNCSNSNLHFYINIICKNFRYRLNKF